LLESLSVSELAPFYAGLCHQDFALISKCVLRPKRREGGPASKR
jgi:hypothetical protein